MIELQSISSICSTINSLAYYIIMVCAFFLAELSPEESEDVLFKEVLILLLDHVLSVLSLSYMCV